MNYRQTFQTFGILIAVAVIATAAAATTIVSSGASSINYAQAQTGVKVSIVPGSSTLGDKAFSPNPVNVKVGDTVTWTNDDTQFHTVTSGSPGATGELGKVFDSKLSGPTALTTQKGKPSLTNSQKKEISLISANCILRC